MAEPLVPPLHKTLDEVKLVESVLENTALVLPLVTPPGVTQLDIEPDNAKLVSVPLFALPEASAKLVTVALLPAAIP